MCLHAASIVFFFLHMRVSEGYNPKSRTHRSMLLCLLMTSCDLSDQTKGWKTTRKIAVSSESTPMTILTTNTAKYVFVVTSLGNMMFKRGNNSNSNYITIYESAHRSLCEQPWKGVETNRMYFHSYKCVSVLVRLSFEWDQ